MASPVNDSASNAQLDQGESADATPEQAFQEAQKWIEAVTGRSFGDKDFRSGLENGILLCELLSSIKPGLVKKINRLPTPIAGLDNLTMFLRGCEELGLKGSQLFDPGDLQDTSIRANLTGSDCSRKLKNVLITIYWLGKAANSCATYNGPTLDLKEFEGLLSMMRKECANEELESPKRSIRDSGYIDSWESERSDSLSPPRHGRDDSFDSLDSFGSRSQNTPSPDTVIRCNSDDSEGDGGLRKLPDVRKDDMSARRVSYKEPRAPLPFNQYLPNKSNQTNYLPAPLRKRRSEREEDRRSPSISTSPVGGERPLRQECVEVVKGAGGSRSLALKKNFSWADEKGAELEEAELKKIRKLEKAGIKVLPASVRYNSPIENPVEDNKAKPPSPDIILRRDNDFMRAAAPHQWDSNEEDEDAETEQKVPDVQKDDLASRRARMNQFKPSVAHNFLPGSCSWKDREKWEGIRLASQHAVLERMEKMELEKKSQTDSAPLEIPIITRKDNPFLNLEKERTKEDEEDMKEVEGKIVVPNPHKDDLARRRTEGRPRPPKDPHQSLVQTSITQSDLETWQRLKMNTENSFTLSSVAPPPRDAEDMRKKCHHMMDRQEAGSVGVVGHESLIKDETITKSPSPIPDQPSRRPLWQEDDDLPPIFRATSVSDETESVSLIDMRDEEDELAYLRAHSQSRHEHLHNQYNKLKEEEDHWQDDLARWKSRRRSASQDLIKKEEERKMMEKLMTTDGGSAYRRKSIKTYKEIVEEKERREQELHEQYCKASTSEEKAAVLQRYALRFTISDAILEKLQLPKLPSAASPMHMSPLHQPEKPPTCTALVEAKLPEPAQTTQTHPVIHVDQKTAQKQAPALPKTTEPSPAKSIKAPEVLSAPTRVPPAPSKPVPLITPKPYSQPKFSQGLRKSIKSDGLIRVNGESTQQESRERDDRNSMHRPINFSPSPPKPATQSLQNEELIVLEASDHQQNLQISIPEQEKEVVKMEKECSLISQEENIKEDNSTALSLSDPAGKQPVPDTMMKLSCVVTTTIVTELTQTHLIPPNDTSCTEQLGSVHNSCDLSSTAETSKADQTSYSLSLTEGIDYSTECIETPMLNLAKRVDHWTWDPNEERRRQERWQQEQERLLQEKYQREQEKLKEEWEKAQREVEEEERRHHEEERRILEETVTPLTPRTLVLSSSIVTEAPSLPQPSVPQDTIVLSLADWEKKQEMLEKQEQTNQSNRLTHSPDQVIAPAQRNGQRIEPQESQTATPQLQFIQDGSWSCKSKGGQEDLKKTASLDRKQSPAQSQTTGMRRTGSCENVLGTHPSKSPTPSQDTPPPSPSRSVSGKKLCSSCALPLGKGAAMIIETLGLYFHIQCFKCGVCKGLLGDTSAGTDVRIRNGLLNCQECYIKSRAAGQPTTL
ncbi:LIM and calponin homology domains-containing protein 1a isoform X6 [Siphateles boraxobius]|uniref:LIM and calponin homology domains-containing protein 1a isoform X6 n=1 Tax=Siphateles boraxobius TaxID=180520 RepID=UPI004064A285